MRVRTSVHVGKSWDVQSSDGFFSLKRRHDRLDSIYGQDTPGSFWIAGLCETSRGTVEYLLADGTSVVAPKRYFIFIPPFSIVRVRLAGTKQTIRAVLSRTKAPPVESKHAFLIEADPLLSTTDLARRSIEYCISPSSIAFRSKALIDEGYFEPLKIQNVAKKLRTSSTVMGRYFKKDFGCSPIQYRNSLRVMDAAMKLVEGQTISEVFQDVGFEDLSRFYRTFRAIATVTPGRFRSKRKVEKRQDQTKASRLS